MQKFLMTRCPAAVLAAAVCLTTIAGGLAIAQKKPTEAEIEAVRASCRSDFMAHCKGVPTGGEAALQCLVKNEPSLSAACQQAVKAVSG